MRLWLLILLLPLLLFGQSSDERIEDNGVSADGEAAQPDDSLYQGNIPILKPEAPVRGSKWVSRVRVTSSFAVSHGGTEQVNWPDVWSRLRMTVQNRPDFRTDLLAVRRVGDPQTIDELHLTVSGRHAQTDLEYTVGTYQVDWGLGILTSASYGSAREFAHTSTFIARMGQGIVARPTSREGSWLRGIAIERQVKDFGFTTFGSYRPWNAEIENDRARLTGVLQPTSPAGLQRRDQVDERLIGLGVRFDNKHLELSALGQLSHYSPELQSVGPDLRQFSSSASANWKQLSARVEFARSGAESAWQTFVNGATGSWQGTVYAGYAAPNYYAPRSQSPESFGEPVSNESVVGVRSGFSSGKHLLTGDVRDLSTPSATPTVGPSRQSTEAELNWFYKLTDAGLLSTRLVHGIREENTGGEVIDRAYQRIRLILNWRRGLDWSVRVESRRSQDAFGGNPGSGSYQHFQVVLPDGSIRPGARVAFYSIPSADGPLLVYEPSVSGAYPLTSFSGSGRHIAAWLSVQVGNWSTRLKATLDEHDNDTMDSAFSLDLSFRY